MYAFMQPMHVVGTLVTLHLYQITSIFLQVPPKIQGILLASTEF